MKLYIVVNELSQKSISGIIQAENDGMALLGFKSFIESGELKKIGLQGEIVSLLCLGEMQDINPHAITAYSKPKILAYGHNYQEKLDLAISQLRNSELED